MIAVSDTSPVIALQRGGFLHLLPAIFGSDLLIPPAVRDELEARDRMRVGEHQWLRVLPPPARVSLPGGLHAGERKAIALAASLPGCVLLIDERDGRREAAALGISVLGTGGVLVEAMRADLIPAVRPVLDALIANGFRIGPETRAELLRLAGELP